MALKIAIIGAGPAGCMLARLLQHSNKSITVTIFEGESNIDFRSQGGTLDLHDKDGQAALKEAGLFDDFLKYVRYDGEAMKLCDKNLLCYVKSNASKTGSTTGRPEIDRSRLREILYNSLQKDTVEWNHKLLRVDEDRNLHFANGNIRGDFDLVVGADGAWSRTRPYLTDDVPFYSGIGGHSFHIPDAENTQPELYDLVNRGSLFTWSDGKSIVAQQMGDGSLSIGTWSVRSKDWQKTCGFDVHDPKATKEATRKEFSDWDPRLVAFTQEAEDHVVPRDLYMLPIGNRWDHKFGVTLVGDAAHLMTPFAGEGVNLALEDTLKLSKAIISAAERTSELQRQKLDENVADFELDMFKRAKETQQMTYDMMHATYMVPGSPRNGIERYILRAIEGEFGYWMTKLLMTPLVYAYFFVFKLIW